MPEGLSVGQRFRTNGPPPETLLAVLGVLGLVLLVGSTVFWPVGTTDYALEVEPDPVATAPGEANAVIAYADLPSGAQRAVEQQTGDPDAGHDHYRATAGEIRRIQGYEYVSYEGHLYAYEVENAHDRAAAFGRGALVGLGALFVAYSVIAYARNRIRPLTAATGAVLPVAVATALVGAYGADLLFGGPGNTLPTRYGGATYFLALTVVMFVGTLGARARIGFRWLPVGIFVLGAAFVMWEASTYIIDAGAPVSLWLVIAVVAALGLVAVLFPVAGLGYLLAAPPDAPE